MSTDSLALRLSRSRTDLARIVRDGPRRRSWLPASEGLFLSGKRHLIAAPAKSGKSIATLAHAVEMALQGARVAILDRENGADEYGRRLASILRSRQLDAATAQLVTERVAHYDYPSLTLDAASDASYVEHFAGVDLVVLDSSRAFLTSLDLDEDSSNDYSRFMAALVDPLHRAGVASIILDNAGHDGRRARGSSSKADLNEMVFRLSETTPFSEEVAGAVKLERTHTRFGGGATVWRMALGGGTYGHWTTGLPPQKVESQLVELHDAVVSILTGCSPLGMDKLLAAARERSVRVPRAERARELLHEWAKDPSSPMSHGRTGFYVRDVRDLTGRVIDLDAARAQ
jgi:AAA domain-containing protein